VSDSPNDPELELLLAQLLRLISPAPAGDAITPEKAAQAVAESLDATAASGRAADAPSEALADAPSEAPSGASAGPLASGHVGNGSAVAAAGIPTVSASEARALIELVSARGIAQGELAGLLGLEKSTVSRLAAGLERKGWIRRGRDEDNQRYIRLYLTPEGRLIATQVWRAWQSRQARIIGSLSEEERAGLSAGLRGLVRGLAAEGLLDDMAPVADTASGGR
jgi:DNA-binding MarR family transcriptional regulator